MQVTVIATGFPNSDLSKERPLFPRQTVLPSQPIVEKKILVEDKSDDKREIQHAPLTANSGEYVKKIERADKPEIIDTTDENFDDDLDEWNAIPAFLRRKKQ
jgi:hypothetical protein